MVKEQGPLEANLIEEFRVLARPGKDADIANGRDDRRDMRSLVCSLGGQAFDDCPVRENGSERLAGSVRRGTLRSICKRSKG